jgi:hypothetical protein
VPPNAAALVESMRDIGYSLDSALADIVDNSITAGAETIDIRFDADPSAPALAVIDDGQGMSADELIDAMRPGSRSPREERATGDLGRFGLGLKTASFSQCRCLTVVTRRNGITSAARWDLDFVEAENDWLLLTPPEFDAAALPWMDALGEQGTLVLWQHMDRFSDQATADQFREHALRKMDQVRSHLELVFHRFLDGERPYRKVSIAINRRPLEPYDPFNSKHPATQRLPQEVIKVAEGTVVVEPFILPHHRKVGTRDWERYAGENGYLRNQGFYLYRGGRLIIHGTWFRMARQSELTKLARVRIDIPNGLDDAWKIDVRKASAQPPFVVRERLRRILDQITGSSHRVYTSRGHVHTSAAGSPVWNRRTDKGQIHYELNREHPVLDGFLSSLSDGQQREFRSVLQAVERSFPVDAIFSDVAGNPTGIGSGALEPDDMRLLIEIACRSYADRGMNADDARRELGPCEPWKSSWAQADRMITDFFRNLESNG